MKWLFENEVVPYLRKRFELEEIITYKVLKVAEIGESSVDDRIGHLISGSQNPTVGVLAHPGQVDVRIAAKATDSRHAERLIAPVEEEVRRLLGRHVFAVDDETMEDVVGKLIKQKGSTLAVYEDLTGGLVAERMLRASPDHFIEGVISNGSTSIRRLLAFSRRADDFEDILDEPEALTDELAWAIRVQAGSDYGLALHAVPDPDEQAENLAKGLTFISITDGRDFRRRGYTYGGRGLPDRTRMSLNAIELVRLTLIEGIGQNT